MGDSDFELVEDDRPQGSLVRKGKHTALRENMEMAEGLERLLIEKAVSDGHLLSHDAQRAIVGQLAEEVRAKLQAELDESRSSAERVRAKLQAELDDSRSSAEGVRAKLQAELDESKSSAERVRAKLQAELDDSRSSAQGAWNGLGRSIPAGSKVSVGGKEYDKCACLVKACELDPSNGQYFADLADFMEDEDEVIINGTKHTKLHQAFLLCSCVRNVPGQC